MQTDTTNQLSPNKQALLKIRDLKQQLQELQSQQRGRFEPIAIVSMACRFPRRAQTPEEFWQCLIDQTDEVSEIPDDRWDLDAFYDADPEMPGRMYARKGVFLDQLDQMDPDFFGISPREATWVDPQQRLLLEVGWEALERAGWTSERIGDHTGIFVGWMHNDYQNEASDSFLNLNPYIATGAAGSFLCGRLAYYLGLQGPSVAVDTACSSSLVALHLACHSLQQRDCDRALVGGVNAICSPTTNILTCKLKALSPSGHSRAFDAAADGYLRGEGCGVVALQRLSDARRDGEKILGVIRGSAIGHNGFSSGLTAPNPKAQEKVIRQALQRAQVDPDQVAYLEAHGTGTELGDPIEMQAAAAALAKDRADDHPLLVGSVKTNIGHLEAAAGMAGLIKVLLAMQHDRIPGQLNFDNPNPHIAWDKTPVKVLTEATQWPPGAPRIAGVSAFGMSGTNAHVVVESPDPESQVPDATADDHQPQLLVISGKNDEALQQIAENLERTLAVDAELSLTDVAFTTACCREHFQHRAALVVRDHAQAAEGLRTISRGGSTDSAVVGNGRRPPRTAWQFTGQGSQYVGMARQLYESEPLFRDVIDDCDQSIRNWRSESLIEVLFADDNKIHNTTWTQPAIFAIQKGLAELLQSRGLRPDVVLGHSVGQYAAACVAGVMTWDEGLRLISERGRLIGELPPAGRMLAVFAARDQIAEELDRSADISLAALNGTHVVLSGPDAAIASIESRMIDRGFRCQPLKTSHAFHSQLMDPILEPFREIADRVRFQPAQLPLICNLSGDVIEAGRTLDGQYWADHIRQPVQYSRSVHSVQEQSCELLLELGPQAVLTRMATADWKQPVDRLISCLHADADDHESLLKATARLFVQGAVVDFDSWYANQNRQRVLLPTYPFQRRRFWGPNKPRAFHADFHTAHPLLGSKISLAGSSNESRFEGFVEPDSPPWLPDHQVMGQVVLPGAAFVEMALAASGNGQLRDVVFEQPLRPTARTAMQTVIRESEDPTHTMEIHSSPADASQWTRNFTANIVAADDDQPPPVKLTECQQACPDVVDPQQFYARLQEIGLAYGPQFQTIDSLQCSNDQVLASLKTSGDIRGFSISPTLLDGALHSLAVGLLRSDEDHLLLPVGMGAVRCIQPAEQEVWCHATWTNQQGKLRTADLTLFNANGEVVLQIQELKLQQISSNALRKVSGGGVEGLLYGMEWTNFRLPATETTGQHWLVIHGMRSAESGKEPAESGADSQALGPSLKRTLLERGNQVVEVHLTAGAQLTHQSDEVLSLDGESPEQWDQLFTALSEADTPYAPNGIVWVCGNEPPTTPTQIADGLSAETKRNCSGLLNLIHELQRRELKQIQCGFQLITSDAITFDGGSACDAEQAKYWGLGRVIGAEQPEYRCRLIDVPVATASSEETVGAVVDILLTETRDNQFVVRGDQLRVPRMQPVAPRDQTLKPFATNPDGCYLITGGLGVLGLEAAKWLAGHGAKQVVLVSRREPNEQAQRVIGQLTEAGCQAIVHSADLGRHQDVRALFEHFGTQWNSLCGVIHAAGVLDDGLIGEQTWERFESVLSPKIVGAQWLHEYTKTLPLDFFILYSSAAAVLGSPGQSNYATGNAYLDGLAWQRRGQGLPAVSVNWGPWSAGMANDERLVKRLKLQGIVPLEVAEAHRAMEQILAADLTQTVVIDIDWRRLRTGPNHETPPMLEGLVGARQRSQHGDSQLVAKLKQLRGGAQTELMVKTIQETMQRILATTELPEIDRPLIEMGLDSLMAVEFSTELQMMIGDQFIIGPTMLFEHPSIAAIAEHVLEMIATESSESTSAEPPVPDQGDAGSEQRTRAIEREPIAVIGMSCRFPGADSVDQYWQNILAGIDSVGEIPEDRWDIDRFYSADRDPGKMYTRQGGFLENIGDFDARFFNVSDQEACWIDPQHRMLLENSYLALEDAGICTHPLADSNVGVFMGIMGQDYAFLPQLDDQEIINAFQGAGLSHSAGVGRISYVFGFEGPSVAVDTASSSSLVALHQAVRSLQDRNCTMALAGGANAILAPVNSLLMSKAGLLSPDGRCKSFSSEANGFGRGEGCGVVVLKRLSDAQRDGDRIMAVIRGGAVVHNGFSGGITSPSGKSQARAISLALQDAHVAPSQVQYLEAHGTGTELGDPMELAAAASVYGKGRKPQNPLLVGSVKANISHLEAAGGVSGLIKTVLALHHGVIPPQAHFEQPSPHVPWKRLPIKIVTEKTEWPEVSERVAGITALGLVGTNAHVILSAAPPPADVTDIDSSTKVSQHHLPTDLAVDGARVPVERGSQLLVLSARNEVALAELARRYQDLIDQAPEDQLKDICYTASVGRRHFEHRVALTFDSRQVALEQLAMVSELESSDPPGSSADIASPAKPNQTGRPTNGQSMNGSVPRGVAIGGSSGPPKVAWMFPGDQSDVLRIARQLYESEPMFRSRIDSLSQRLVDHFEATDPRSRFLSEWLATDDDGMSTPNGAQLFSLQSGLAGLWDSWGIRPDAVAGFGVGQYSAACVAGCMSWEDALILVVHRVETLQQVAANDADSAGLDRFEQLADTFNYYPPNMQLVCSLSGNVVPVHRSLGGSYWRQHLTDPIRATETIDKLAELAGDWLIDLGSNQFADLKNNQSWQPEFKHRAGSLEQTDDSVATLLHTLGQLYVSGINPDFVSFHRHWNCRRTSLPHYPFQKRRYWITEVARHNESPQTISR